MSKTMKWIIIVSVLVVIALIIWLIGMSGTTSSVSQPANTVTSANNTTGTNTSAGASSKSLALDQINRDVANMDLQFQAGMTLFANLGSAPSQAKIVSVASHFKTASLLMTQMTVEIGSAISNSGLTALKSSLSDMGSQLSNSTSEVATI